MKRLTLKEMTESEQREVKTTLDRARKAQGRDLTNSEQNKVREEAIDKVMAARAKIEKVAKAKRKADKIVPSSETFSWTTSVRERRGR